MGKIRSLIRILKVLLMVLPVLLEAIKLLNESDDSSKDNSVLSPEGVPAK